MTDELRQRSTISPVLHGAAEAAPCPAT
jgi:hypothetical protein